jgi:hypothetical protein
MNKIAKRYMRKLVAVVSAWPSQGDGCEEEGEEEGSESLLYQ